MRARLATPRTGGLAALAAVVAVGPLVWPNKYFYDVAILAGLNAIVCVGLNLLIATRARSASGTPDSSVSVPTVRRS
jgi:branched-chain amino acid transport system permease protein